MTEEQWVAAVRRTGDLVVAAIVLLVLGPMMILIAVLIKLTSPGPALFSQPRVGLSRESFRFFKFRTMLVGGDDSEHRALIASELRGEAESCSGSYKLAHDRRVTRLGTILRRTSLDELPQLINVLRGDMTLVGPRPCLVWEAEMFPPEFDSRFSVRPGMTGLWQVSGRSTTGTIDMLRFDVDYVRNRSLCGDAAILGRTVAVVLRGDGAR